MQTDSDEVFIEGYIPVDAIVGFSRIELDYLLILNFEANCVENGQQRLSI
jgi:hypothetical protein